MIFTLLAYVLASRDFMRVVVGTNVFTGALTGKAGSNRRILHACFSGKIHPLMGVSLYREYEEVMERPETLRRCPLTEEERQEFFDAFLSVCDWISIYILWRPNLRDEGDNHLVELAVAGGASAIVTHNTRDLVSGELAFPALKILKPAELLTLLP